MSEQGGNVYSMALQNLYQYEDELREAFAKRAGRNQQINSEQIVDLLDDVSVLFAFDCEGSKSFFTQGNRSIPKGYNLNALKFNQFYELFEMWLQKESEKLEEAEANSGQYGQDGDNSQQVTQRDVSNNKAKQQTGTGKQGSNYENNKRLLNELLRVHNDEYKSIFQDRMFEEGQTKIHIQDFFVFLQEAFYLDAIELKEKIDDEEDFFRSVNSFKRMLKTAEKFFLEEKKVPAQDFDIREASLTYDECFQFLYYWFRTDKDVIMIDNRQNNSQGAVRKVLLDTIEKYENMINETSNEMEKALLRETIQTLQKKLEELDRGAEKDKVKGTMDQKKREEKRLKALREIFDFYCTQQLNTGKSATFAKLDRISSTITLGTFKVFLKKFRLKIDHLKLIQLYNKSAGLDDNLNFEEFLDLLNKVALRAEIAPEEKAHVPNPEIMKEYKPSSYKNDPTYKIFKQNDAKKREETDLKKKALSALQDQTKREAEKLEEIWEHMGLYDDKYRSNMGWLQLPFNSHDKKDFRTGPKGSKYKYKPAAMEGKSPQEIVEEVQKRNELRKLVKDLKSMEKDVFTNYRGSSSPVKTESEFKEEKDSYLKKQAIKAKMNIVLPKKLTMKKVETFQHKEIGKIDERFNPHDLIDDNDADDNLYLAEYSLHNEQKPRNQIQTDTRRFEEYGKLKKASKGFAINGKYGTNSHNGSRNQISDIDADPYSYGSPRVNGYQQSPKYGGMPLAGPNSVRTKGYQPSYSEYDANIGYSNTPKGLYSYVGQGGSGGIGNSYNAYNGGNEPYVKNNGYYPSKPQAYNNAMNRANQVEMDLRKRENQMMNNVMNIQNNQIQKGMKAIPYNKPKYEARGSTTTNSGEISKIKSDNQTDLSSESIENELKRIESLLVSDSKSLFRDIELTSEILRKPNGVSHSNTISFHLKDTLQFQTLAKSNSEMPGLFDFTPNRFRQNDENRNSSDEDQASPEIDQEQSINSSQYAETSMQRDDKKSNTRLINPSQRNIFPQSRGEEALETQTTFGIKKYTHKENLRQNKSNMPALVNVSTNSVNFGRLKQEPRFEQTGTYYDEEYSSTETSTSDSRKKEISSRSGIERKGSSPNIIPNGVESFELDYYLKYLMVPRRMKISIGGVPFQEVIFVLVLKFFDKSSYFENFIFEWLDVKTTAMIGYVKCDYIKYVHKQSIRRFNIACKEPKTDMEEEDQVLHYVHIEADTPVKCELYVNGLDAVIKHMQNYSKVQ